MAVQTFAVPHDAVDPVGYMFHHGAAALGYLTDLGFATKLVHERVRAATTLLIETNHDTALLNADTKRPWSVKQRITSRHGHLSNEAAAAVVALLLAKGAKLERAVLGHLSRDCNQPDLAIATVRTQGGEGAAELEIIAASQGEISARMVVEERRARAGAGAGGQRPRAWPRKRGGVRQAADDLLQLDLFARGGLSMKAFRFHGRDRPTRRHARIRTRCRSCFSTRIAPPWSTTSRTCVSSKRRARCWRAQLGMSLAEMARSQQYPVVVRTEIDYKRSGGAGRHAGHRRLAGTRRAHPVLVRVHDHAARATATVLIRCRQMLALVQMPGGQAGAAVRTNGMTRYGHLRAGSPTDEGGAQPDARRAGEVS